MEGCPSWRLAQWPCWERSHQHAHTDTHEHTLHRSRQRTCVKAKRGSGQQRYGPAPEHGAPQGGRVRGWARSGRSFSLTGKYWGYTLVLTSPCSVCCYIRRSLLISAQDSQSGKGNWNPPEQNRQKGKKKTGEESRRWWRLVHKYTRRRSPGDVMVLHCGHSFLFPC